MNQLLFKITIGFSALMFLKLTHNMKSFFLTAFLFLLTAAVYSQQNLSLRVVDSQTGEPLANASIKNTTTNQSYLTDKNGTFTALENETVEISISGYANEKVVVSAKNLIIVLSTSFNTLEDVVITSTRNKILKRNSPQQVTVLSSSTILNTGARDLTDVMKKTTGIDIIQYPNLLSGVGIRGFRPQFSGINQRTLLLIDGRPAGATNLATMDLTNVERIEVVKGAASALYGSQAMGGVVNVITKRSKGDIVRTLTAGYGSYSTFEAAFAAGGNVSSKLDFNISVKYLKQKDDITWGNDNFFRNKNEHTTVTDTYRNANFLTDSVKVINDVRGDGITRPYTSYQFSTGSLRFGYDISRNWRVDVGADYYSARALSPGDYFDGATNQASKNPFRYSSYATLAGNLKSHSLTFKLYSTNEVSDFVPKTSTFATSKTTTTFNGFQLQDNFKLRNHSITFGIDRNRAISKPQNYNATTGVENAPSSPAYGIYSTAGFINSYSTFFNNNFIVTLGSRLDKIDFDVKENAYLKTYKAAKSSYSVFSPGAGIKYKLPQNFDVHASIGRAFVTPDAFNVAGYSVSGSGAPIAVIGRVNVTYGNPDLKPERSTTCDAGLSYFKKEWGLDVDLTYFNTNIKDRITTSPTTPVALSPAQLTQELDTILATTTYINADNSTMRGLEFGAAFDLGAFSNYDYSFRLFLNATRFYQLEETVRDKTITTATVFRTKNITNVADITKTFGIEYAKKGYNTRLSGRAVGKRYDTDNTDLKRPEIEYAKFMVMDFSTTIPLRKRDKLILQVNNFTDENYYEKRGYNMPGRNFTVKYSLSF